MVWKVQGNLPTLPQSNVGMFVPCQENSSFPVFFANCCLVVCCGKFRFCLLGHRRRLHRAGLWWTQRPMTSRAPELQVFQRCPFCWLLKLSFKFRTWGKNINAFILNYSQTKLPYFQGKCIFSIPSHNNHITIWCDHKNHRLRKLKRRKLSLFI